MKFSLRLLYLYLFSFVGLLITVIGSIQIVDLTLKKYVFHVSEFSLYYAPEVTSPDGKVLVTPEEQMKREKQNQDEQTKRQLSNAMAMITIGAPLYLYHWRTIKKENKP